MLGFRNKSEEEIKKRICKIKSSVMYDYGYKISLRGFIFGAVFGGTGVAISHFGPYVLNDLNTTISLGTSFFTLGMMSSIISIYSFVSASLKKMELKVLTKRLQKGESRSF